jgi:hypothetical protein
MTFTQRIQFLNNLIDEAKVDTVDNLCVRITTVKIVKSRLRLMLFKHKISGEDFDFYMKWVDELSKRKEFI